MRGAPSLVVLAALLGATRAYAEDPAPLRAEDVKLDAPKESEALLPEAPPEAPPPPPRKKGLVAEGALGALGFMGQFRHVAPAAPWLHLQVGYEFTDWLMLFGEGELAFTDSSVAESPSEARAFPIFGFGLGPRFTIHATPRFAAFAQASIGALKADVPRNALTILGYRDAESLGVDLTARLGVEWYQVDRHMALGLAVGVRDAKGFAKIAAASDTPLMGDASAAIRYTF